MYQRQTNTGAHSFTRQFVFGAVEQTEYLLQLIARYTGPVIAHDELDTLAIRGMRLDTDQALVGLGRKLDRIVDQVDHDLGKRIVIDPYPLCRGRFVAFKLQLEIGLLYLGADFRSHCIHEFAHGDRARLHFQFVAAHTRQL